MTTFSDLIQDTRNRVLADAIVSMDVTQGGSRNPSPNFAESYADAVATYLALSLSKVADYNCSLVPWYTKEDRPGHLFSKQAIPIVWDYAELNPLADIGGTLEASIEIVANAISGCAPFGAVGNASYADVLDLAPDQHRIISTDPPYYDNVPYAELSDYFYVWLRRTLKTAYPDLFSTLATPKAAELVAAPERHGGKDKAEKFL